MDLQMPVMDGYEATKKIKELDKYKTNKIPILALTAFAITDIRDKVLESGMDDFICKPINPNELNNKVAKHVSIKTSVVSESVVLKTKNDMETQIIEFKYYDDLARGDAEFLKSLIVQTIDVLEEFKANYTRFFGENNIAEVEDTIHKAKSTIVNIPKLYEITSKGKELLLQNENDDIILQSHIKSIHDQVDSAIGVFNKKMVSV